MNRLPKFETCPDCAKLLMMPEAHLCVQIRARAQKELAQTFIDAAKAEKVRVNAVDAGFARDYWEGRQEQAQDSLDALLLVCAEKGIEVKTA